jgi:hypothetical protein
MGSQLPSDAELLEVIKQLPSDAELAEFINTAEEILMRARKVARLTWERILKAPDQPPPKDAGGATIPIPVAQGREPGYGNP